jgi:acyl-CoA reductase-like NAD-dependent aldehyde dehydrogenase
MPTHGRVGDLGVASGAMSPTAPQDTTWLTSRAPLSGEIIATFPITSEDGVVEAIDRARIAARWWADLGWSARRSRLLAAKRYLAAHAEELVELVHREVGKPRDDARLEVALSLEHLHWAAVNAQRVLAEHRVRGGLLTVNHKASLSYEPAGVVGVIGPWNYPVFTPIGSIAYALAAGNAVVFKPSEFATAIGDWLSRAFHSASPEHPLVHVVIGAGNVGAALVTSGVDLVSFTGSTATGRRILAACAASMTPAVVECGGKDAVLVDADADLAAAADAITFGAFSNAGQTCVGVERVYAHRDIHEALVAEVARRAQTLRPGTHGEAAYGPMTLPQATDTIRRHITDAVDRGANVALGGVESIDERTVNPIILTDVPEDSLAMLEETFGPTVAINSVRDLDEAVDRANASGYGLAASVFGRSIPRVEAAARRLRVGMVSINSWVMYAGVPSLPWGGVGESGIGRIHGADGLRAFTQPRSIVRQRFALPIALTSFERPSWAGKLVLGALRLRHGSWRR